MIRLKHCKHDDPALFIKNHQGPAGLKLQSARCYDSDNEHTYWEWEDVEIVDLDADDYEIESR